MLNMVFPISVSKPAPDRLLFFISPLCVFIWVSLEEEDASDTGKKHALEKKYPF